MSFERDSVGLDDPPRDQIVYRLARERVPIKILAQQRVAVDRCAAC